MGTKGVAKEQKQNIKATELQQNTLKLITKPPQISPNFRDFMHIYHGRWPVSWNVSQWGEYGMLSVLQRLGISYGFYLCNTMLVRVLAKALCLSICVSLCVSQVGVLSKGMNGLI